MEISNRTFGLFCVAMVGVVVYVRAQSSNTPVVAAAAPHTEFAQSETKKPAKRHGIPDSTVPPEMNAATGLDDQPILVEGDVQLDRPVPLPNPAPASDPAPAPAPAAAPPADTKADVSDLANQDDISDVIASLADAQQQSADQQMSDRQLLRLMLSSLNERQRREMEALWYTMSPDDRQNILDNVRGTQQGGY